jgi:signal transduction histidine kinase
VSDTGIGIKAKYLDKIFERFHRVEEEDEIGSHKVTGSGLGLAISKEIVDLHNGKIWAESEPGQGSRFCFTLPAQVERKKGE